MSERETKPRKLRLDPDELTVEEIEMAAGGASITPDVNCASCCVTGTCGEGPTYCCATEPVGVAAIE